MKNKIFAIIFFGVLVFVTTFPLTLKVFTHIPAFFSTDESFGILWSSWFVKYSFTHNTSIMYTDFIAYPWGIHPYTGMVGYIFFIINYVLSLLTTPVLTYNIQVLFNILATATATYYLALYLLKEVKPAFISGMIFGFSPYIFVRSWQHIGETYLWPIPLFILFILKLKDKPSLKIKAMFILTIILSTVNFDVIYYCMVILLCWSIYSFVTKRREALGYILRVYWLTATALLILIPQFMPLIKRMFFPEKSAPSAQNMFHRPFEDLFSQSARPLSYLLPSSVHPVFGKLTSQFIGSSFYGISFTEHTLYLGWFALLLAIYAFNKRNTSPENKGYIKFFVFLALFVWLFSQPPWWNIGHLKLYMPSFFMYKILPMFRAYCRFGSVLMLAVAVLAGFGSKLLFKKFKSRIAKWLIFLISIILILFDFWSWPPYKIMDVSAVPEVYTWIKALPEGSIIAEYPMDIIGPAEMYKLYQTKHEKKIINATLPGTYAHKIIEKISRLSDFETAGILSWLKVRYVIVHRNKYLDSELTEVIDDFNKIPGNPGLKFIKHFAAEGCPQDGIECIKDVGEIDVYEVIAIGNDPKVER
ncbi:MAG: hypothetical protein C4533_03965 [Candidatus Omnitrophota bacterium]|jgi:hypothetical protein|nr:MAG: hypothetical protein C4533_03965 [Candidatus Omnitrophota bacterium]